MTIRHGRDAKPWKVNHTPAEAAAFDAKLRRWAHNGLMGCVAMMESHCHRIMDARTTTPRAKNLAFDILCALKPLKEELKTRVDS